MKKLIIVLAVVCSQISSAQFKTSSEVAYYAPENAKISAFKFSGGETSLEYNFYDWEGIYRLTVTGELSAVKRNALTFNIGLPNTKKFVDVDGFEISKQGYLIGLNYIQSATEIIENNGRYKNITSFRFGFEYKQDNFMNYDPQTDEQKRIHPETISFKAAMTHYLFNFDRGLTLGLSFSGNYSPKAYNNSSLLNFTDISENLLIENNIVPAKDFDGKFGTVDNGLSAGNLSFSLPLIFDYTKPEKIPYFVPVPFFSTQLLENYAPKYFYGIGIGAFGKKIFGDREVDQKVTYDNQEVTKTIRKFNNSGFLSFGIDWYSQNSVSSKPNYYLSGTIAFD